MKSWASVLLQVKRLHLSLGLPKWMSRPTGMPVALPEFPKGRRSALREVARRIPPGAPSGQHPPGARASRPHALPWVIAQFPCDAAPGHTASGNRMGPAEAEPWRRCRSIRVEEMGEAMPRFVRAGRPRSRGGAFSPDAVTPTSQYCRSIRGPLVIEGAPSLFVPISVHSWFVFISKTKTAGCFSSDRPAGRGRGYPILPFSIRTLGLAF